MASVIREVDLRPVRLSLFLSGILALVPGAMPQTAPPASTPTFKTGTTNVLVDVVVAGPHGVPVEGLSKDSFTVLEDGKIQLRRPVTRYSIGYDVDVAPLQLVASGDGILHGTATLVTIMTATANH